jgi:hypothetical protein
VLNKTGIIGVHLAVQRTRKGTLVRYYCATWFDQPGKPRKRSFSVAKYGRLKARSLATTTRREAIRKLLRPAAKLEDSRGRSSS